MASGRCGSNLGEDLCFFMLSSCGVGCAGGRDTRLCAKTRYAINYRLLDSTISIAADQKASARPTGSNEKRKSEPQPVISTEGTTQSGLKRRSDSPASSTKRAKVIKPGKIEDDLVLLNISRELGVKWMDVGVALGMKFMDLKNTIVDNPQIQHDLKPMEMLQKWKSRAVDYMYATLASALEKVGLHTCAQTYCYAQNND